MTSRERELRSKLKQLISSQAMIRGTLLYRERSCGRANCKCAQGQKHPALYLVVSEHARQRQIFIPKFLEAEVRLWVTQYQKMRKLGEDLSRIYLNKLEKREL
jgi:hypothetical protein